MNVLWEAAEPLTVRDVLDALNESRTPPLAYTTVMTVISRLAEKGAATRVKQGKGYAYTAAVGNEAELAVRTLLRDYGTAAIDHFVAGARSDPALMNHLRQLVLRDGRS